MSNHRSHSAHPMHEHSLDARAAYQRAHDEAQPGSWMYHGPILEHHASGMMAHFDVVS